MWGREIRRLSCVVENLTCEHCVHLRSCPYGTLFEPTSSVFAPQLEYKTRHLSPPFIIDPPIFPQVIWEKGETKDLFLTVIGDSVRHLHYFVETVFSIAETGVGPDRIPFEVVGIDQIIQRGDEVPLYLDGEMDYERIVPERLVWNRPEHEVEAIMITIKTPLRLQNRGELLKQLNFQSFWLACIRRLEMLEIIHTQKTDIQQLDKKNLPRVDWKEIAAKWFDLERYSARNQMVMKLGGIMGTYCLEGDLTPIMPILECGSYFHIGKQTVFGLGKYQIWYPSSYVAKLTMDNSNDY